MGRLNRLLPLWLLIACMTAGTMWGQSTFATITGVVQDPSGAVVPNASVVATHVQRNNDYNTTSNEAGQYTVANLPEGTYTLVAKAAGFQDFKATDIIVVGRDIRRVDATLAVGAAATSVEVTAGATLIETETARIGQTKEREVMRAMPLMLRRAWDYMTMTPQLERTNGWNFRLAGSGEYQATATMDGATLDSAFAAPIGPTMDRTEMVQELRVDIAQANAEMATMGQLSLISRAGTNELHGVGALYYNNNELNSRDPFSLTKNKGWGYQWIAGAGGPVYLPKIYNGKNKTFFFVNIEIATGPVSPFTVQRSVPLNRWRAGDFSTLAGTTIKDPLNNNAPFSGNIIPASRLNSAAVKYQDLLMPKQNYGSLDTFTTKVPTYLRTYSGFPFVHQPTISYRFDHRISDRQFMYGRWTSVRWNFSQPETQFPELTEKVNYKRNMDNAMMAYTFSIRPTLLNEFNYGLTSQRNPNEAIWDGNQVAQQIGLQGLAPNIPKINGLPAVSFQNSGVAGVSDTATCNPCGQYYVHSFTDNVSWFKGSHSFKFGASVRLSTYQNLAQSGSLFSSSTFNGRFSGFDYADFLLGIPGTLSRAFPAVELDEYRWGVGLFAQDSWKVNSRLTLNLGVRWDGILPWREDHNRLAMFDPNTGKIVIPDAAMNLVSPLMPTGYIGVVAAGQAGFNPKSLINADLNNIVPRLGFAYRPWGNNTVFRGGFGLATNQAPRGPSAGSTVPYVINEPSYTNPTTNPLVWPNVFPSSGTGGPTTVSIPNAIDPNIQLGKLIQYSFTIEHQRWDTGFMISYNGTGTRHGVWARAINNPVANTQLYINKVRPFPRYPGINYYENGGGHQYNGLTMQALRKMKRGFYYQTYFTWAKDMMDLEDGGAPENGINRARDRGPFVRQAEFRLSGNVVYELPFGHGRHFLANTNRWVNGVLGGWRVSAITAIESGRPLTATWTGPDPTGTRYTTSSTPAQVTIRADALGNPNLSNPTQYGWFNVAAFGAPAAGRFGTEGVGVITGPPIRVMHNSLAKDFPIRERVTVRFEVIASNSLNHPNWGDPQMNITNASRGLILATTDLNSKFDMAIPRNVQFHMRFEW